MQPNDFERFRAVMLGMGKLFEREIDNPLLDAYWLALRDWRLVDFETACGRLMQTSRYMPRPADFTEIAKANETTASEAWAAVLEHCKGAYRDGSSIDLGGPIDQAVAGLGGYRAIAFHNADFLPLLGRQFVERYNETRDAKATREAVLQVADLNTGPRISRNGLRKLGAPDA